MRPGGGAPDSPGWTVRVVPNLYPALAPSEHSAAGDRRARGRAPATARAARGPRGRRSRSCSRSLPATGAHEVIVNGPQPVLSLAELPVEQVAAAMDVWRERMRTHEQCAYVQLIVNERREAGASLPHTHAQLYALDFVPAAVARERERAGAYATRTMGQSLLGDLVAEEVRLRERIVAIDEEAVLMAPYASRLPFQLMLAPRRPVPRFEQDGPTGRGAAARRPAAAGAPPRREPAAEPVGAHGAARRRALLLADRRAAAADAPGRARAVDRREPEHRRARARGGAAARGVTRPPRARGRLGSGARCHPRTASYRASPPSRRRRSCPTAAGQERLSEEFLGGRRAARRRAARSSASRARSSGIPDRTWHGRTYVPATALTSERLRAVRLRALPAGAGRTASRATSSRTSTSPRRRPSATRTGSWTCATR